MMVFRDEGAELCYREDCNNGCDTYVRREVNDDPDIPDWAGAANVALRLYPGFTMLTYPMQGMLIGAVISNPDEYGDRLEPSQRPQTYAATLRAVDNLYRMHGRDGWGYEA